MTGAALAMPRPILTTLMRAAGIVPGARRFLRRFLPARTLRIEGCWMRLHPHDNYTEYKLWAKRRPPEPRSLAALRAVVAGRRALVFDIGANCGAYTLPLAAATGPGSRVIAFEPNPVMAERLRANIALNAFASEVRVEACALGQTEGESVLMLNPHNLGGSSLRREKVSGATRVAVPVRRLTPYVRVAGDFEVFAIKIDVEGLEDEVLLPLVEEAGLARPDAILLEVAHRRDWRRDLEAELTKAGFVPTFTGEGNMLYEARRETGSGEVAREARLPAEAARQSAQGACRG